MKLGTLKAGGRDGTLVVVAKDGARYSEAGAEAPTLQAALDAWERAEPGLRRIAADLDSGRIAGSPVDPRYFAAPLPRAYEWVDGSAFLNHVILVRRARGAEPPETLRTDPLVYQGGSGVLLGPADDILVRDASWGADFEAEVCVILGDTPMGTTAAEAGRHVRLILVANDVTLRNLVPPELAKGFGFFQSKPATAFAPFAITPDELGPAFHDGRVHLRMRTTLNGAVVGDTETGPEMHFSFFDLVAHVARTRAFTAGTILGSGTISNADRARGVSCLAERRMIETIEEGRPRTPFLAAGDRVTIALIDEQGGEPCGRIEQSVVNDPRTA
jgi:fumarylacetoacetate (FAA) hydrolase